jgi:hypothetical protein
MNTARLSKLIKMLSSPNDGEVVAAARALQRALAQQGADIHDLAGRVEAGYGGNMPSFYGMACELKHKGSGRLTRKEAAFIDDMVDLCRCDQPTPRQARWLALIWRRIGRQPRQ